MLLEMQWRHIFQHFSTRNLSNPVEVALIFLLLRHLFLGILRAIFKPRSVKRFHNILLD
jgi:hypothetical protein